MKNIRLLFYLPNLKNYLDRMYLVNNIARNTQKTILLTSKIDISLEEHNLTNIKIINTPKKRSFFGSTMIEASLLANKIIKKEKINLVHDTFGHLLPLMVFKNLYPTTSFISSFYNIAIWDFKNVLLPKYGWLKIFKDKNHLYYLHRIITQSIRVWTADLIIVQANDLIKRIAMYHKIKQNKIISITNNIEPQLFNFTNIATNNSLEIKLLFAGNISFSKGGDFMIKLIKQALKKDLQIKISLMGEISTFDYDFYSKELNDPSIRNNFEILKRVSSNELLKHYKHYDWLIHFTYLDGSPRVVLEALASGLPVIASIHPGITIFDPNNEFILFSQENKIDNLLEKLKEEKMNILKHNKRAKAGQNFIHNNFTSNIIGLEYIKVYKNLLTSKVN